LSGEFAKNFNSILLQFNKVVRWSVWVIYEPVDLSASSFDIEAKEKFYHRYMVYIPRIKFFV